MNRAAADRIARAVLYEGYILYPYRPSVKNRQRWTFGGLYPEAFCRSSGTEACGNQTECLVRGTAATAVEAAVRFLHLTARQVGEFDPPLEAWQAQADSVLDAELAFKPVQTLRAGEQLYHTWQEAEEREYGIAEVTLGDVLERPRREAFSFPGGRRAEPVRGTVGEVVGVLVREQRAVEGDVEVSGARVAGGVFRLTLRVVNRTPADGRCGSRDEALLRSLVSTHALLGVRGGEFVSLLDPPPDCRGAAAACRNVGTWPVLVGEEGQKDTLLSSPIILYDYPQVAPESPGDFFDGTEIDEMLTLRILTLTDEEKRSMAAVDGRAGELLARTEAATREQLMALHGTVRGLRPAPGEGGHG
jgi:hydrogenase maturation protease